MGAPLKLAKEKAHLFPDSSGVSLTVPGDCIVQPSLNCPKHWGSWRDFPSIQPKFPFSSTLLTHPK